MLGIMSIHTQEQLEEAFGKPKAIIFKNSLSCGISRHARGELEAFAREHAGNVDIYMIDDVADRTLSNTIAARTGVRHESPQAFYLENGAVVWHASHFSITKEELEKVTG